MDVYYGGYVNVEGGIEGGAGSATIPDFNLEVVTPMQVNQGKVTKYRDLTTRNGFRRKILGSF
jgi:hypothetical protein